MALQVTSSSLRRDQAKAVRERIVAGAIEVIEAGEVPTMRAIAHAAEISERTLYRYYGSLEELQAALIPILRERAGAAMADDVEGLPDYIRRLFTTFDQNSQLARALVTAPWVPTNVSRPNNLAALSEIIDAGFPTVPKADRDSAAATLRVLYSAAGWAYLADCGFDLEASIGHVQWITNTTLEKLRQQSGEHHA